MSISRAVIVSLLMAGCATADRVQQLEEKVTDLEKKVEAIEKAGPSTAGKPDAAKETAAKAVYDEMSEAVSKGDIETAKAKLEELDNKYSGTTAYKRASKVRAEIEVIGKKAPDAWKGSVEKWFQGEGEVELTKGTTLVVFWEVWCPHCRREVPNLKETYSKYKGQGLEVVGFTKISRSSTEEKVVEFLKEQEVNYPTAKENGDLSKYFNVSGIPAAAVLKDGEVVWRGHPGRLNDELLSGWL